MLAPRVTALLVALGALIVWLLASRGDPRSDPSQPAATATPHGQAKLLTRASAPGRPREESPFVDHAEEQTRGPLRGIVRLSNGRPAARATVVCGPWRMSGGWASLADHRGVMTDRQGAYAIELPGTWTPAPLWVASWSADGAWSCATWAIATGARDTLDLTLVQGGALMARLESPLPSDAPAWLEIASEEWPEYPQVRRVPVDADTRMARFGGHAEEVTCWVRCGTQVSNQWRGPLLPGKQHEVAFSFPSAPLEARIAVGLSTGKPIPEHCTLHGGPVGRGPSAWPVPADGVVRIQSLAPAEQLWIAASDLRLPSGVWWSLSSRIVVEPGVWQRDPVRLTIAVGANPRFLLTTDDGQPLAGMRLGIRSCADATGWTGRTGADGTWSAATFASLPPGRYDLRSPGVGTLWHGTLPAGLRPHDVRVAVGDLMPCVVSVVDADDAPVHRMRGVHVRTPLDERVIVLATDANGEVRFLVPRDTLEATTVGFAFRGRPDAWTPVRWASGWGQARLALRRHDYGSLRGQVQFTSGAPAPFAYVDLEGADDTTLQCTGQGRFAHPWLLPGTYDATVRLGSTGKDIPVGSVVVSAAGAADVVLRIPQTAYYCAQEGLPCFRRHWS